MLLEVIEIGTNLANVLGGLFGAVVVGIFFYSIFKYG